MERPITHEENEELLRRLRDSRRIRSGVDEMKVEVRFEDVSVDAKVRVGLRALPTLPNTVINAAQELMGFLNLFTTKRRSIKILDGVKGIIKPSRITYFHGGEHIDLNVETYFHGEHTFSHDPVTKDILLVSRMTLIIGPPGSGKSTLLRALSGKLSPNLKFSGRVAYNDQELSPSTAQRMCAYVEPDDLHHAEMTVRETLDFSSQMFGTKNAFEIWGEGTDRKKTSISNLDPDIDASVMDIINEDKENLTTSYFIKLLGLSDCADITIGDQMRRGISGGQKKRVTIGEMLVSLARSYFMDDISTGLDSSSTFEIVKFLKQMTYLMDLTMVISLLQPSSETFELFDDIILLCEGQIVYQGPRENVLEFFESIGFKCPDRKNIADFLQEVTSKMDQAQYWAGSQREYEYIPVAGIADYFQKFHLGKLLEEELHKPYDIGKSTTIVRTTDSYNISKRKVFKACFSRECLLMKRNSLVHMFKIIQIALLAFVVMTLFLRTNMHHTSISDGNKFMGAIFAGLVIVKFNGMAELTMTIKRLHIFYKQRAMLGLPGWALLSSTFILSLPTSLIEAGIWTSLTYFVIGFAPSAIRFLQQLLVLFCIHQMSMSLFRFIAAVGRVEVLSNMLAIATLVAIYILGGFVISKDDIQPWLLWGHWISPLTYGQNAMALNEFLAERWSMKIQDGGIEVDTVGKAVLKSRGMFTQWHWFWICIGALLVFSLTFNILTIFVLQHLNRPQEHQFNIDNQDKDARKRDRIIREITKNTASNGEMVLPFQPLTLSFSHINYYVDMPIEMKNHGVNEKRLQLLQDVSGAFRPGVMTAIMGITGAGKTTLLDVLAGRKTGGYIEGTVRISGFPKKQETFARISGYCEQTDIHSPFLTVYESLQFSAWLRLPSHVETHMKYMFVEEVMGLVELLPLKNAMVGLPGINGLSAEQRKRLTIAVELVSSPSIIFMDEPTTGLDARAAAIVMRTVRKTVDTGRTVVCTIHQPSIEIFESFDELLLMKRGGQLIYGGSLGPLSKMMIQYFESVPGVPKFRNGQNPAVWMLDITSSAMEYNICVDFADVFYNSSLYRETIRLVDELSKPQADSEDIHFPSKYPQSIQSQCMACLWKLHKSYWKNPQHNVNRFITTVITSLIFGVVFWQIGSKTTREQDIFNILGVMYGSALFLSFANAAGVQPIVRMEQTVLYREKSAGMYSSISWAISQVAVEVPYIVFQILIFSSIVYPMIGFQFTVTKLCWFMLFLLFSFGYFTLFGMVTVAVTPIQELSALLSFLIFVLWNVFSGFIVPLTMIPSWWRWLYWADPAAWTVYGLMYSQLGDRVEVIRVPGRPDQTVREYLENYLGLEEKHFNLMVALHIGIIVLFFFIFCFSIKHLNFQKR